MSNVSKEFSTLFIWPILVMIGLYFIASIPGQVGKDAPQFQIFFSWFPPAVHNVLHVPAYALLAWTLYRSLFLYFSFWILSLVVVILASGYGAFLEWHQLSVAGRYASFTDVLLNFAGSVIGVFLSSRYANFASVTPPYNK